MNMAVGGKLASNSFYLFIQWFIATLMGLMYWLVAGKFLLPAEYGIISTSFNLAMILSGISMLGLGPAVWKLIPEYLVKKRSGKIISLIRFSFKVILITNFIILAIFLGLPDFISSITNLPFTAVILTGVMIFLASLAMQSGSIMYGFQYMKKFLFTDLWGQLSKVIIAVALLVLGFSYLGPILGLVAWFAIVAVLRFLKIPLRGKQEKINKRRIMTFYALPALMTYISFTLFLNGQYVLLSALQNTEVTGIYTIAMIMITPIVVIPNTLTSALIPITSQLSARRDTKKQRSRLIELAFRYSVFITIPVMFFLIVFSKVAVLIFSRPEYLPAADLFPILAIASLLYGLGILFLNNIYAIGRTKLNRNIIVFVTVIFFALAVPLIIMFSSFGLASAYITASVTLLLLSYFYLRKYVKIKLPFKDVYKSLTAGLIALFIVYTMSTFTEGLLINVVLIFLGFIIYLLLLRPLRFYRDEDGRILKMISEKLPRFKRHIKLASRIIGLKL